MNAMDLDRLAAARQARGLTVPLDRLIQAMLLGVIMGREQPGPVKLARDSDRDPLIGAVRSSGGDQTPSMAFADHLEETGTPGAHVVREAAPDRHLLDWEQVDASGLWHHFQNEPHPDEIRASRGLPGEEVNSSLRRVRHRTAPGRRGIMLDVYHSTADNRGWLRHAVLVKDHMHLDQLLQDYPEEERKKAVEAFRTRGYGPIRLSRRDPVTHVYVSPSTREGSTFSQAYANADNPTMRSLINDTPGGKTGYGVWSDGAEETRHFTTLSGSAAARQVAEQLRDKYKQKSVLTFHEGTGSHILHILRIPQTDPERIYRGLAEHGIQHVTLLPHHGETEVHVLDTGDVGPLDNYARFAGATHHEQHAGQADFV